MAKVSSKAAGPDWGRFEAMSETIEPCLIVRSWGWDKSGKNHFGYTMPGPIVGLYLDPAGTTGVVQKFLDKKVIRGIQYRFNKSRDTQGTAQTLWGQWLEDYYHALDIARSVQIDETEAWELARFAEFGRESGLQRDYGPLNGIYRGLIQAAFDKGVNVQLIQKVKEKWVNGKSTDGMDPQGFKQAGNIVQVSLEHTWNAEDGFQVKVVNCRQNTAIWGETYANLDFPTLGQLVYPDTDEDSWT